MALTTRLPDDSCPSCRRKLDAATNLEYYTPKPGDVTVCIGCQSVLQWDENMRLHFCDVATLPPEVVRQVATIVLTMERELPRFRHEWN